MTKIILTNGFALVAIFLIAAALSSCANGSAFQDAANLARCAANWITC